MAREIMRPVTAGGATTRLSTHAPTTSGTRISTGGRVLTTPRSARYLQAIARMDASATLSPMELDETIDAIRREFDEKWAATPLGLVSKCYLGHPYEVHILSLEGRIVEHFEGGQAMPGDFERARSAAQDDLYLVVEVYRDKLICVRADGSTVTLEG